MPWYATPPLLRLPRFRHAARFDAIDTTRVFSSLIAAVIAAA